MGYFGKLEEKRQAMMLRTDGYSYRYISKITGLSKDTISRCCRDIVLTDCQLGNLDRNQRKGQMLASVRGAKTNQLKRIQSEETLMSDGFNQIGAMTDRDKFVAGIALYQAEGSKTNNAIEFTNSDQETVKFMVLWLEKFCFIKKEELHCSLWLHDNLDENVAINYWSSYLDILRSQFDKTYFVKNKIDSKKIRKNIHQYGIIKIRYYDVYKLRLLLGWIRGVLNS